MDTLKQENDIFLTGDILGLRLSQLEQRVEEWSRGSIRMEEHIALPQYGQIMVRFQADKPDSITEVDQWERQIQSLAGDEFMVDLMGSVYRQVGVDYGRLDDMIERLGIRFSDEPMIIGPYADRIRADARVLLGRCGLPETKPVWEIQWEDGEYNLLLLGKQNRIMKTVEGEPPIHLMEANGALCEALMRAAFAARRMGVSLGRLMLEAMEDKNAFDV